MFPLFYFILLLSFTHCKSEDNEDIVFNLLKQMAEMSKRLGNLEAQVKDQQMLILDQNIRLASLENKDKTTLSNSTLEHRLQHLEELAKTKVVRTCEELHDHGIIKSDTYFIDPDGELTGFPPIRAFCDFENGFTEILHDSDNKSIPISHCNEEGCFTKSINYLASDQQISALISLSSSCQQKITFDCFQAPLSYNDVNIGWWSDRHNEKQIYFTGSNYGEHMCSCSEDNSCSGNIFHTKCNCDHIGGNIWLEDSGVITNMTALPITAFTYGPLEYETQEAFISIGRLQCSGKDKVKQPPSSCNDLKKLGEMRTGLYPLLDEVEDFPMLALCDMEDSGYDGDPMKSKMWIKSSSGPGKSMFSVQHSGQNDIPVNTAITFDTTILNVGNCLNLESGVFTANTPGHYQFAFSALTFNAHSITDVTILINGESYMRIYDDTNNRPTSISKVWILDLKQGDTVSLKLDRGGFYGNIWNHLIEFIGMLL